MSYGKKNLLQNIYDQAYVPAYVNVTSFHSAYSKKLANNAHKRPQICNVFRYKDNKGGKMVIIIEMLYPVVLSCYSLYYQSSIPANEKTRHFRLVKFECSLDNIQSDKRRQLELKSPVFLYWLPRYPLPTPFLPPTISPIIIGWFFERLQ